MILQARRNHRPGTPGKNVPLLENVSLAHDILKQLMHILKIGFMYFQIEKEISSVHSGEIPLEYLCVEVIHMAATF